jgi:hypothetical protein
MKARFDGTVERVANEIIEDGNQYRKRRIERREAREQRKLERKESEARRMALIMEIGDIMPRIKKKP